MTGCSFPAVLAAACLLVTTSKCTAFSISPGIPATRGPWLSRQQFPSLARQHFTSPMMLRKTINNVVREGFNPLSMIPEMPAVPLLEIPSQKWQTSCKVQATAAGAASAEEPLARTEGIRLQSTISTGHRPPNTQEQWDAFKMEFWPWIVVGLIGGGMSVTLGTTIPMATIVTVEALFWLYCKLQHYSMRCTEGARPWWQDLAFRRGSTHIQMQDRVNNPEPMTRDIVELWKMCLENVPDSREFLEGWFYDRPFDDITRDDVKDFLAWALYSNTFPMLAASEVRRLTLVFKLIESYCKVRFPRRRPGQEPLASMRFSIEPVQYHHKPLLFYASTTFLLGGLGHMNLVDAGFTRYNAGALNYWIRMPENQVSRKKLPIVFVHGVGVGLVTYMKFVRRLMDNDCPILCVELPFVSMSIESSVPTIDQQLDSVRKMMDTWGFDVATFVGHSYGSILLSWMVQHAPERVASVVFIDPVVIMLNLKTTLYNFLYRHSTNGKISDLVGTELFLNHALRRHFWWYRNIIWAQDMHKEGIPSIVIVAEKDEIVPSAEVAQHIMRFDEEMKGESLVKHHMVINGSHGDMLFDEKIQEEVCSLVSASWETANLAHVGGELQMLKKIRSWGVLKVLNLPALSIFKNKVQMRVAGQLYKQSTQVGLQLAVGARWKTRTLTRPVQNGLQGAQNGFQEAIEVLKTKTVG